MLISLLCLVFGDILPFFWKSWRNKKKNNTRKMFTLLQWVLQYVIIFTCSYAKPCRNKQFCLHWSMFNFLYSILQVWRLLQTWPGGNAFVSIQFTVQFIFIFVCHWDKNKIYFVFNKKKKEKKLDAIVRWRVTIFFGFIDLLRFIWTKKFWDLSFLR